MCVKTQRFIISSCVSNAIYVYILAYLSKGSTEQACSLSCTLRLTVLLSSLLQLLYLLALKSTIFSKLRQATHASFSCFFAEVLQGGKDFTCHHLSVFLSWARGTGVASKISPQLPQKPPSELQVLVPAFPSCYMWSI